jgi:hypothetical protein
MKMEKVARKLSVGFESFKVINQPKTDVNLRFSSNNMQRMAALLDPAEQGEFLLLWKPQITRNSTSVGVTHSAAAAVAAAAAISAPDIKAKITLCGPLSEDTIATAAQPIKSCTSSTSTEFNDTSTYSDTESCPLELCSSVTSTVTAIEHHGAVLTPEQEEEVRKMRNIPIEWRSFHISLGAFLYSNLFQMPVPPNVMRITKPEVSRWLNIKPQDQVIQHHFKLYK